jgi:hypothetical protein
MRQYPESPEKPLGGERLMGHGIITVIPSVVLLSSCQ